MVKATKKIFAFVSSICIVLGLIPTSVLATEKHSHTWVSSWTASDTHHWHACNSDNCTITTDSENKGYGKHDFSQYPYRCIVCQYSIAHEHYGGTATCQWNATCEGCGTVYGDTNPNNHQHPDGVAERIDSSTHEIVCTCGYVFKKSEPHNFTPWDNNGDGTEERWCEDCLYAETRKIQNTETTKTNTATSAKTEQHTLSDKPTQITVENRNDVVSEAIREFSFDNSRFQPEKDILIPKDATFSVEKHTPEAEDIFGIFDKNSSFTNTEKMKMHSLEGSVFVDSDGTEYRSGEIVSIDNEKYCIDSCKKNNNIVTVIGLGDGVMRSYDMENRMFVGENQEEYSIDNTPNRKIKRNGITYDVSLSYKDSENNNKMVLSYGGEPAGQMDDTGLYMYDDFKPEVLKKEENANFLGTIEMGKGFEEFGLNPETSYSIHWIDSKEICLESSTGEKLFTSENANQKIGTVTQDISLGLSFVPFTSSSHYVAVHTLSTEAVSPVSDVEFGSAKLSKDKTTLTATYSINHFSPFTVYAFTEVEEKEIKSIVSNTGKANKVIWNWITIAVVAVATLTIAGIVIYKKKKK